MLDSNIYEKLLFNAILVELKKEFPLGSIDYQIRFVRAISKGIARTLIPYIKENAIVQMSGGVYKIF